MKSILIIAIALSLILGAGYFTMSEVSRTAHILISHSDQMKSSIENGNWEQAQDNFKEFSIFWHNAESMWTILLNHNEIDNIDISLAKIEQYIKARETGLALGEMAILKLLIKHIPEKEKLTLENIF